MSLRSQPEESAVGRIPLTVPRSLRFLFAFAALVSVFCSGCVYSGGTAAQQEEARRAKARSKAAGEFQASLASAPRQVSIQELDQLTYGYADRYAMLISSALDAIKRDNQDPVQRRLAHQIKLNGVLAMNDIVSSGDPYARTLDLVVAVTLDSVLWIDEDRAEQLFGSRAPPLIQAFHTMRVEAWQLASKVLNQEQLELLDYIILEWRRTHRDIDQVVFVKFDNFAGVHAAALLTDFKAGNGFLAPLSEASQVLKDWGRLTERAFWYSKRAPNIAGIEAEGAVNEILSAPEIGSLIQTVNRMGQTVDSLPPFIEGQRNAIFAELDARQTLLTNTLSDLRQIMVEANAFGRTVALINTNLQQTLGGLSDTLKVADGVGQRFGLDKPSSDPPGRPFDIQEYAVALTKLNEVVTNTRLLSLSADQITRSPGWTRGVQDVTQLADRRLDRALRNICLALGFAFILAVVYRVIALKLAQRMAVSKREKT